MPKRISYWGNDRYGVCVTTEEAFAKACAEPEIFLTDKTVIDWAGRRGWLNGAYLTEVMDAVIRDGISQDGNRYSIGPYKGVNYEDDNLLKLAIATGPVKIALDADSLPNDAGNVSGWHAIGTGRWYRNTDHCVALCGYGTAQQMYKELGLALPSQLRPDIQGYLLFTWNTIGFVDDNWLEKTCTEAYVRDPVNTVNGVPLPNPTPGPSPVPPVPPVPPIPPTPGLPTQEEFDRLVAFVRPMLPAKHAAKLESLDAFDWKQLVEIVLNILYQWLKERQRV